MSGPQLGTIFRNRCGDQWIEHFTSDEFNINEDVPHEVPSLLSDKTIAAIARQAAKNRTYTHRKTWKDKWLLSGYVFCDVRNYRFTGNPIPTGDKRYMLYYRHARTDKHKCDMLNAPKLEDQVAFELLQMSGDIKKVERAVKAAIPNPSAVLQLQKDEDRIAKDLARSDEPIQRVVDKSADDVITDAQAERTMTRLKSRGLEFEQELANIQSQLRCVPTTQAVRTLSEDTSSS